MVDLSGLGNLTGPGNDDVLELNVDSGGLIKLDNARQITGGTRFNIGLPSFQIPQATLLDSATVNLAANAGFLLPQVASITSSALNISTGAVFTASQVASIVNSSINLAPQSKFDAPQLNSITSSSIGVAPEAIFDSPRLSSMDNVPLNLVGNGSFLATNLSTYRNSDIPILPGRDFRGGLLTNIYGSRISVIGGMNYRVGALSYEMPVTVDWASTIFSADGSGSLLDLSSLKTVQVNGVRSSYYWGPCGGGYAYCGEYSITASNRGVIDLSGLDTIYGTDPSNYGGDDWLALKVQNGGNILLTTLRQVTRRTRFDIEVPQFAMPALQTVDNTGFNLSDGTRLDLPSLQQFDNSWISFGFNSSFNAPQLINLLNSDLNLVPGKIFNAPAITNINGSRISVANGATWTCTAQSYVTAGSALLSADGLGSVLDFSSMETIAGSGLTLSVQNGGSIRLGSLRQVTGATSFVLGDGQRMDLTNLTRLVDGVSIRFGTGSTFNAPRLVEVINSDLALTAAGNFVAPPLTNIYASRLSVSGGRTMHVAAQSYEMPLTVDWCPHSSILGRREWIVVGPFFSENRSSQRRKILLLLGTLWRLLRLLCRVFYHCDQPRGN